jgi:hypothetical protein
MPLAKFKVGDYPLRKLAAQYLAEAEDIESKESGGQHALARTRQMKESAS